MATNATTTVNEANVQFPWQKMELSVDPDDPYRKLFDVLNTEVIKRYLIAPTLSRQVTKLLKTKMPPALDGALTKVIRNLDEKILGVISEGPSPPPPLPAEELVAWDDVGGISSALSMFNNFLSRHVEASTLSSSSSSSTSSFTCSHATSIDDLIDHFTDHGAVSHSFADPPSVSFPLQNYSNFTLALKGLNASGLDTLKNLTLIDPRGEYSALSGLEVGALNISVDVSLLVEPADDSIVQGVPLLENFTLGFNVKDLELLAKMFLGIEKEEAANLEVLQLLSSPYLDSFNGTVFNAPCALSTIYSANLTDLSLLLKLSDLYLHPPPAFSRTSLEAELDVLIDNFLSLFVGDYNRLVTDSIYGILQGPLRSTVNGLISDYVDSVVREEEEPCVNFNPVAINGTDITSTPFFQVDECIVLSSAELLINEVLGVQGANDIASCASDILRSSGVLDGVLFTYEKEGLKVEVGDVYFHNADSFYQLELLVPEVDHYHMVNDVGLGNCSATGDTRDLRCHPLTIGVAINVTMPSKGIESFLNVSVAVGDFTLNLGSETYMDLSKFGSLQMKNLTDANCIASSFQNFSLYSNDMVGLGAFSVHLKATTSDGKLIDKVLSGAEFTKQVDGLLDGGLDMLVSSFNAKAEDTLRASPYLCAGLPVPDDPHHDHGDPASVWLCGMAMVIYGSIVTLAVFVYLQNYRGVHLSLLKGSRGRRKRQDGESGGDGGLEEERSLLQTPLLDPSRSISSNPDDVESVGYIDAAAEKVEVNWKDSLMFNPSIPAFFRFGVPVTIIATMGTFLSSNLSVGASVTANVSTDDFTSVLPPLFAFTLSNSVHDMWKAGVYPLSILIALCSGGWPYLKVFLMLIAWVTPVQLFSKDKRETLLMWLDALGKFSLVDAFVLVLMMVAFRFHMTLNTDDPNAAAGDVLVTPEWGFYGFLFATMTSLGLGHIVLAFHRHAVATYTIQMGGRSESVMTHVYARNVDGKMYKLRTIVKLMTVVILISSMLLLAEGARKESFQFEFKGAAGLVLGEDAKASYSLISLGQQIPKSVDNPNDFGIRWIETTYYIFALVMPFACLGVMLSLFLLPLTTDSANRLFVLAEVCNAWSALDVFVISIVAALLEIEQFASFIIGNDCDDINAILERWFDSKLKGDDVCFDVVATLAPDCAYLFSAAALSSIVNWVMIRIAHSALEERLHGTDINRSVQKKSHFVESLYSSCMGNALFVEVDEIAGEGEGNDELDSASLLALDEGGHGASKGGAVF